MAQGAITHRPAWAQYQHREDRAPTEERPVLPVNATEPVSIAPRPPQRRTSGEKAPRLDLDAEGFVVAVNGRPIV